MATRDASPPRQALRRRHRSSGSLDDFCDDRSPSPLPHIHRNRWVAFVTYLTNCAAGWALTKLFVSIVEQSRYGLGVFLLTLLPRLNRLSHLVLRWPLLVLVYALVGVELILYFLLRTLVAALELAVASPTHRRLRSALRRADDYAQWLACARALDASRGVALWQADLRSTRYNWPFVRRLRARLRSARSQNDWRGVADTLRLCSRPNVGGIMAPELFAVSYAGAPKIVVTDFVDEVRISASRGVEMIEGGRGASSPSDEVGGGFFLEFGPVRTASGPLLRVRERAAAAMASSRASTRLHRRSPRPSTGSRRPAPTTSARRSVEACSAWPEKPTAPPH